MKKLLVIIFSVILLSFGLLYISGLETRYFYKNEYEKEYIELFKDSNLNVQLYISPGDSILQASLIFNKLKKTIILKSANISISEKQKLKLKEVSASDGLYNWVKEKNGTAKIFDMLPKHLKTIEKDIQAYFVYCWSFNFYSKKPENIEIELSILFDVDNNQVQLKKIIEMKLSKEFVFKSPIRFH